MSGIITGSYFKNYFNQPSAAEIGTMVAILEVGAFISSLAVGRVGDIIGRRKTILYGSIVFFIGGALQTMANGMPMMMLGRFIAGFGVGALSTIVPVYQSEISPPHNRGKLACIEFSGNIIGYTTSVWVDYFCGFIESDLSWRVPLLLQCVMGALLGFGSLIIVESPRWLLDNDHDEEGIVVIANLYGKGDIHNPKAREEFREIKMNVLLQRQEGERTYAEMFRRYGTRVFIAMSAQALAQLNGINVISYYAPMVFESAGWQGHDAVLMAGVNGITYFLSTIPPWYLVDRWGRRPILLSGALLMAVSLSLISYFIYLDVSWTPNCVVAFVMIYNAAFGYSWGPIPWLYPPEILPLSIRSKGASLSTATNWAFNWLVGEMTPTLQVWIKWRLYLVHAFFCVVSFVVGESPPVMPPAVPVCRRSISLTPLTQSTSSTPRLVVCAWRRWTLCSEMPAPPSAPHRFMPRQGHSWAPGRRPSRVSAPAAPSRACRSTRPTPPRSMPRCRPMTLRRAALSAGGCRGSLGAHAATAVPAGPGMHHSTSRARAQMTGRDVIFWGKLVRWVRLEYACI
jgi:sugar porter (SP) family MFS transporter